LSALLDLVFSQDFLVFFGQKLIGGLSRMTRHPGRRDENEPEHGGGYP
jgi:hypothetical protein